MTTKKDQAPGKRFPLNMRTTFEMRQRLERAAKDSGVSIAQEMERRLERSFEHDLLIERMFANRKVFGLTLLISNTMTEVGQYIEYAKSKEVDREGRWLHDPYAFDQTVKAVNKVLEAVRPQGEIIDPMPHNASGADVGEDVAQDALDEISFSNDQPEMLDPMRKDLGPLVDRIRKDRRRPEFYDREIATSKEPKK